jgi:16S rRNA processing protein RimM
VMTDFPDRFESGRSLYLDGQPLRIEESRPHKQHLLVKLATIDSIIDAEKLRARHLTIPRSELRPLPDDEYYAFQIIGLRVSTTRGGYIGEVTDVMTTAGNDVYIVQAGSREVLIPAIDDVVKSVDLDAGVMIIEAIEGLLAPDQAQRT